MTQENGFFKIEISGGGSILHVYPPAPGGMPVSFDEVISYLKGRNYDDLPLRDIKTATETISGESEVYLGAFDGLEISAIVTTKITLDKMKVICRIYPQSFGGMELTASDILNDLAAKKVSYGIKMDTIDALVYKPVYCTDIVIAEGKQPRHGTDARIEYFFNTDISQKPKSCEDGSVNFLELDTVAHISQGQKLARLTPADRGESGTDVNGKDVRPRTVKDSKLEYGANISISDDGMEIYSDVDGHATLVGGKVFVSNVLEIPADVSTSTGNIDYYGSVHVRGSIREGFTVIADGDIIVDGVIEGATIACGGQVIIRRGIQGQSKVSIRAGSNVLCKYIENAEVHAGGYIEADSILHSFVYASGDVVVNGKNGSIVGGVVRAGGKIEAKNVGTEMGGSARLEVGVDPEKKDRYNELQKLIRESNAEMARLEPVLLTYKKAVDMGRELTEKQCSYMSLIMSQINGLKKDIAAYQEEFNSIHQLILRSTNSKIIVNRDIYPGSTICVSDIMMLVRTKYSGCQFRKKFDEIEILPI